MLDIISVTRYNKISLNENACNKLSRIFKGKLQIKNAAAVYQFVNLFSSSRLKHSTKSYIERCFTIVSHNENFLELEYSFICKILASSELLITSEIEVLKVANRWLNHNIEERSKYAKNLLSKVRLHLLSTETISHLLSDLTLTNVDVCAKLLNKMLDNRVSCFYKSPSSYLTTRYCNQKNFKLLVFGGLLNNSKTDK